MKTVRINGMAYQCPFADRYRPQTPEERETLAGSIAQHGITDPVLTYDSSNTNRTCVLDGIHRAEIANQKGKPIPVKYMGVMSDEAAARLLDEKHLGRRNLSVEDYQRLRDERILRIVGRRAEGASIRTIAAEEKVATSTVQRDLKAAEESGVTPGTPEPEPVTTGRDGKKYRRVKQARPADEHPHADLLRELTTLSGKLSARVNEEYAREGQKSKLYRYLVDNGYIYPRDASRNGVHKGHIFKNFQGLRRLVKLAGLPGPQKTKAETAAEHAEAMREEISE